MTAIGRREGGDYPRNAVPGKGNDLIKGKVTQKILDGLRADLAGITRNEGEGEAEFEKRKSVLEKNIEFCKVQLKMGAKESPRAVPTPVILENPSTINERYLRMQEKAKRLEIERLGLANTEMREGGDDK